MRTDILDLHDFYARPLGLAARGFIAARLEAAWDEHARLRIAGFGHAEPFLDLFPDAERRIALAPGGQGVIRWPPGEKNLAALCGEWRWPLPDASIDRLLVVHGLEESDDPKRLMREIWRVLASDGRVIIVVSHRRGLWSMIETTPFAAGRPYLKRQLERLLQESLFRPTAWSGALYFPPFGWSLLLRAARAFERAGERVWPGLGGVIMVEASKDMLAPVARAAPSLQRSSAGPVAARQAIAGRTGAARIGAARKMPRRT
ncbi:MAG: methyltransferase domain-containing protein [Parvularculaceae bacterium]|nr:methyltransferase domain-containing protein [Parvularculaceae bacterium]